MTGQTLSHFEITTKLGEFGMGLVYRAETPLPGWPLAEEERTGPLSTRAC